MKILIRNARFLDFSPEERGCIAIENDRITFVSKAEPQGNFDRIVDARGRLLTPAFYNAHAHSAMTIFRGYGEDLPLDLWLNTRIFPAEEKLTAERVYLGSKLAILEMIRHGIVSFSDMYYFCESTVKAVIETGVKANISRSVVSFDENADYKNDTRVQEGIRLFKEYNGAGDGRVKVDMSLHAEYTNVEPAVRYMAEVTKDLGTRMHIHLSETEKEHNEAILRRGVTPTEFFYKAGIFDSPVVAAHCVYLTDEDRAILAEHGATAVHNPISNLKLGSGIMPLAKTLNKGVRVALGTDGVASNNRHDMLREMQTALLLQKGVSGMPDSIKAADAFLLATRNGALAQGRTDCGEIAVGAKADIVLFDTDKLHLLPIYDHYTMLAGASHATDVSFVMADGKILYEDGEFTTVDVEKLRADFTEMHRHYFD